MKKKESRGEGRREGGRIGGEGAPVSRHWLRWYNPMDTSTKHFLHQRLKEYCRREDGKIVRSRRSGSLLWDVSPSNIRSYSHRVLTLIWLSIHEMIKNSNNRQTKVDGRKILYEEIWTTKNTKRNNLSQGIYRFLNKNSVWLVWDNSLRDGQGKPRPQTIHTLTVPIGC